MMPLWIIILLMALILTMLVLKPELGIQFKAFSEKFAFGAEWKPTKSTRYRFVIVGIFIEAVFLLIIILMVALKG